MPTADLRDVLGSALVGGYAVGAFNAIGLESAEAIVGGAEEAAAPVVLAISENAGRYASLPALIGLSRALADAASIPVVIHFDHGTSLESCVTALELGCTSVMLDGSNLAFDENVRVTELAVRAAHARGAACEGEIGLVGGKAGRVEGSALTDPAEAVAFAAAAGVDALACALGTRHGMVAKGGALDVERAKAIAAATGVPLVLHGSSGVPEEKLKHLAQAGIAKVNFATDLNATFTAELRDGLSRDTEVVDPRVYFAPAREKTRLRVVTLCRLLGAAGRAKS